VGGVDLLDSGPAAGTCVSRAGNVGRGWASASSGRAPAGAVHRLLFSIGKAVCAPASLGDGRPPVRCEDESHLLIDGPVVACCSEADEEDGGCCCVPLAPGRRAGTLLC